MSVLTRPVIYLEMIWVAVHNRNTNKSVRDDLTTPNAWKANSHLGRESRHQGEQQPVPPEEATQGFLTAQLRCHHSLLTRKGWGGGV